MDIYSFILSRDVAEHCRKINKVWNTFEMAVIIGRSNCSILERHSAWRELITSYPDMPTPANIHYKSYESLHGVLSEIIAFEEQAFTLFKTPERGYIYTLKESESDNSKINVFSTLDNVWEYIRKRWERDEENVFTIRKVSIDGDNIIEVICNYDGNYEFTIIHDNVKTKRFPMSNLDRIDLDMFSAMYFIDIPVPFKRGDILCSYNPFKKDDIVNIFVLESLDSEKYPERHAKRLKYEMSDGTDVNAYAYFTTDEGILYSGNAYDIDRFEYYRNTLQGKDRILHYVSLYIKDEIDLPFFLLMQNRLILEELLENIIPLNFNGYSLPKKLYAEDRDVTAFR